MKLHLKRILKRAVERGSRVIIPAFSLGRTQTLVYFLNALHSSGELPDIPVFVDSPLSKEITTVYRHHVTDWVSYCEAGRVARPDWKMPPRASRSVAA